MPDTKTAPETVPKCHGNYDSRFSCEDCGFQQSCRKSRAFVQHIQSIAQCYGEYEPENQNCEQCLLVEHCQSATDGCPREHCGIETGTLAGLKSAIEASTAETPFFLEPPKGVS